MQNTYTILTKNHISKIKNLITCKDHLTFKTKAKGLKVKADLIDAPYIELDTHLWCVRFPQNQVVIATDLVEIRLPEDSSYFFQGFDVSSIDFTNCNTQQVTNMFSMFCECQAEQLNISNFDTSQVTNMSSMFKKCQVKHLDVSNFNTSQVTNMDSMFLYCQSEQLDLSNFDTSQVLHMDSMFQSCQAKSLNLSNFNLNLQTTVTGIFLNCNAQVKTTDSLLLEAYTFFKNINKKKRK